MSDEDCTELLCSPQNIHITVSEKAYNQYRPSTQAVNAEVEMHRKVVQLTWDTLSGCFSPN